MFLLWELCLKVFADLWNWIWSSKVTIVYYGVVINYLNNAIVGIGDFFISIIFRKFPMLMPVVV